MANESSELPVVIVGNGPAAAEAILAMRGASYGGPIALFADNFHAPYSPVLGTYFAAGRLPPRACFPWGAGRGFYRTYSVTAHLGCPVTELDAPRRVIRTAHGDLHRYSVCLVASGGRCIEPAAPGADGPRVYHLRTFTDAVRLRTAVSRGVSRAVVVGASQVGMRVVNTLLAAGSAVILADAAPQVLPHSAHPVLAGRLAQILEACGVELHLGAPLVSVEDTDSRVAVTLGGGDTPLQGDMVVLCLGVRPNVEYVHGAGMGKGGGLLVDGRMATNAPGLFAAGDAAEALNTLTCEPQLIPVYANARRQGRVAGRQMAGQDAWFPGSLPQNITHVGDQVFFSIGDVGASDHGLMWEERTRVLYAGFREGRLWAVNGLGCPQLAGPLSAVMNAQLRAGSVAEQYRLGVETQCAAVEQAWPGLVSVILKGYAA